MPKRPDLYTHKHRRTDAPTKLVRTLWFRSANVANETVIPGRRARQAGLIFAFYRVFIASFLLITYYFVPKTDNFPLLSGGEPILPSALEPYLLSIYLALSFVALFLLYFWRTYPRLQLLMGFIVDVVMLTLFLYSGYAKEMQIVMLYMVVIAASFMLLRLKQAAIVAAVAVLSLVFQQVYYAAQPDAGALMLQDALLLSLCLVAVGFLSWSISQRLANAERSADASAQEILRLNAINDEVIKHLEQGIIVIAQNGRVILINDAARNLLRLSYTDTYSSDMAMSFELERVLVRKYPTLAQWYMHDHEEESFILDFPQHTDRRTQRVRIKKSNLPQHGHMLLIEDLSQEQRHAQQLKLASLGQLTASIAHEIRNPLGAISQASELLMEDADEHDMNGELYKMIYNQTGRVNRIIEDVMRLSRQEPPKQLLIELRQWLPKFLDQHYADVNISTHFTGVSHIVFDPNHLEQIFVNLINNALRHTKPVAGSADVQIVIDSTEKDVLINILDNGDGVADSDQPYLFNPFFTKSVNGTGLGLYLSQAFSEANHARLVYIPNHKKTCFRLISMIADNHPTYRL